VRLHQSLTQNRKYNINKTTTKDSNHNYTHWHFQQQQIYWWKRQTRYEAHFTTRHITTDSYILAYNTEKKDKRKQCTVLDKVRRISLYNVKILKIQLNHHLIVTDTKLHEPVSDKQEHQHYTEQEQVMRVPQTFDQLLKTYLQRLMVELHHHRLG